MSIKKFVAAMMAVVLSVVAIEAFVPAQQVYAGEWTKASVNKELKKTDAKLKTAKAKYIKAKKAYNKAKEGTITILAGRVLATEPLIVYYPGLLGVGQGYYWIESGKEYFSAFIGTGVIKTTGGYREYNGQTCALAKGVNIDTKKMQKLEKKYKKLKAKKAKLKHALVNKASLDPEVVYSEYGNGYDFLVVGETYNLYDVTGWTYTDEAYSTTGYKSSDDEVASVTGGGKLTAEGPGEVTITVTSSISKKKTKTKLVIKDADEIPAEGTSYEDYPTEEY